MDGFAGWENGEMILRWSRTRLLVHWLGRIAGLCLRISVKSQLWLNHWLPDKGCCGCVRRPCWATLLQYALKQLKRDPTGTGSALPSSSCCKISPEYQLWNSLLRNDFDCYIKVATCLCSWLVQGLSGCYILQDGGKAGLSSTPWNCQTLPELPVLRLDSGHLEPY